MTPGKGGQTLHGIPVYNTVQAALANHPVDAASIYVPGRLARDAALEAIDAGIPLILLIPENVPRHDVSDIFGAAAAAGVRIIGPNTNGLISPGQSRLGGIGGYDPDLLLPPGRIGLISRSGGMVSDIGLEVKRAGLGFSTCVAMGGDVPVGTGMVELLALFAADPDTDAVMLFGEPGGTYEEEAAAFIRQGGFRKPVVACIAGQFQESFPPGVSFGHAAALIAGQSGRPSHKLRLLQEAGAVTVTALSDLAPALQRVLSGVRAPWN